MRALIDFAEQTITMIGLVNWVTTLPRGEVTDIPRCSPGEPEDEEQDLLARLCRSIKAKTAFEIGTFRGRTATLLAKNVTGQVYTLDLPKKPEDAIAIDARLMLEEKSGHLLAGTNGRVKQLWGDSRTFDFSPYHGQMDIVWADAGEPEENVLADLKHGREMLTPDGILMRHDFSVIHPTIRGAIMEFSRQHRGFYFEGTTIAAFGPGMERLADGNRC
jgi:predicted O-methyltransferase YrrM